MLTRQDAGRGDAALDPARAVVRQAQSQLGAQVISGPALLAAMCDMQEFRFLVDGEHVPSRVVLSEELLYPAVAWAADCAGRELMRADFGFHFEVDQEAMLGVRVSGPPVTAHTADLYRALFLAGACTTMFSVKPRGCVEITSVAPQLRELLAAELGEGAQRTHAVQGTRFEPRAAASAG